MLNFAKVGDSYVIDGETLTEDELDCRLGKTTSFLVKDQIKNIEQRIMDTAKRLYNQAKLSHRKKQIREYLNRNPEVEASFAPFTKTKEDFLGK